MKVVKYSVKLEEGSEVTFRHLASVRRYLRSLGYLCRQIEGKDDSIYLECMKGNNKVPLQVNRRRIRRQKKRREERKEGTEKESVTESEKGTKQESQEKGD
jgi:predicted thioesterase